MVSSRKKTGDFGEAVAANYLTQHGYHIIARNWRCATGEIDIIAKIGGTLVFVEVRTRHGSRLGSPEESITPRKQQKLIALAFEYLAGMDTPADDWRIDAVAVVLGRKNAIERITHIPFAVGDF